MRAMIRPRIFAALAAIALCLIALGAVDLARRLVAANWLDHARSPLLSRAKPAAASQSTVGLNPSATASNHAAAPEADAPLSAALREDHDRRLWPCAGLRRGAAECTPKLLPLARGRLRR